MEFDYMENMTVSMKWSFIPWNESAKKSSNSMELSAFHRKKNMHYVDPRLAVRVLDDRLVFSDIFFNFQTHLGVYI
jgi:hypothetical protein